MATASDQRLNELKQKYASVLNTIQQKGVRLANVHVENNKLLIRGTAPSEAVKNQVWDQIKLVDASFSNDLVADISVDPNAAPAAAGGGASGGQTYTVKAGDSLSKIAQQFYGDASAYTKIFNANRDKLSDPDKIFPGQDLVIPA
jgi:nucleoid-associated protein YgaU